jgi:hypothetical protein
VRGNINKNKDFIFQYLQVLGDTDAADYENMVENQFEERKSSINLDSIKEIWNIIDQKNIFEVRAVQQSFSDLTKFNSSLETELIEKEINQTIKD